MSTDATTVTVVDIPCPTGRPWYGRFLDALTEIPSVSRAARKARISRGTAYNARRDDPAFAEAWKIALAFGYDALEDVVVERAFGNDPYAPTYVGMLLKAHRPERYDRLKHQEPPSDSIVPIKIIQARKPEGVD